jgi:hypothetical protein
VYSTPLKNQGEISCVADWNGVFADQAEYSQGSFSVTFAFTPTDLLSTPGSSVSLSPSYSSRLGYPTTIAALTEPRLVVSSITAQAKPRRTRRRCSCRCLQLMQRRMKRSTQASCRRQ